jgi:ubiquitin-conjugating enzyme E2 variant
LSGCLVTASVTLCVSNQIHAWAHAKHPPTFVQWLQSAGILLGADRHAAHHQGAHTNAYATVSGWSNPLLDRAFAGLEAVLAAAGVARRFRVEQP